jgi:NADH-quinone oxidoreductase subunit J
MLQTILFYLFSTILIGSAFATVLSRNPVHAVLFLILAFFNAAGLFLLLGAEFIAFTLIIVYVGAVMVLFLFVVMMLDINFAEMRRGLMRYVPVGAAVGALLLVELIASVSIWYTAATPAENPLMALVPTDNIHALGRVLYTDYFYPFQVSGFILLVAMIGAIVLTLRHDKTARRQNVKHQMDRQLADVIEIVKVESGKGVL